MTFLRLPTVSAILFQSTLIRAGGFSDFVRKAKWLTSKPVLAKGIHTHDFDIQKVIKAGADYVLVVGRIPRIYQDKYFIEPLNLNELKRIPDNFKVVWNSHDLKTGGLKKEAYEEAKVLWEGWLCQASNIVAVDDIREKADVVLVNARLIEFSATM